MNLIAQGSFGQDKAVNFLQFNRDIWGYEESSGGSFWSNPFGNFQRAIINNRIEGFETPGGIISAALPYLFAAGGLIVFAMLAWGAFEVMLGATNAKMAQNGKTRITNAIVGFVILFSSYWIAQIIQYIFGLNIGV